MVTRKYVWVELSYVEAQRLFRRCCTFLASLLVMWLTGALCQYKCLFVPHLVMLFMLYMVVIVDIVVTVARADMIFILIEIELTVKG